MNLISAEELKALVQQSPGLCVSIYMPVAQGTEIQQNPIRFKNLIREAEDKIVEYGFDKKEAAQLLEPVRAEVDQENFWENQSNLLAIFVGSGFFRYYTCPVNFDELVVVSDNFHVKPLMPMLTGNNLFYVLALSKKEVRLIECTAYSPAL
ncbi:hypothetical protein [Microcoleus sp. OTE_8_concoct_300]|uniref:hypothetical protein n=1 Tax=Microcoleus sp. OTE_8_concoct_300 TaxID=2964710 RepID=UPI00403FA4DB